MLQSTHTISLDLLGMFALSLRLFVGRCSDPRGSVCRRISGFWFREGPFDCGFLCDCSITLRFCLGSCLSTCILLRGGDFRDWPFLSFGGFFMGLPAVWLDGFGLSLDLSRCLIMPIIRRRAASLLIISLCCVQSVQEYLRLC